MKKIFMFFIISGIIVGLFIGIRAKILTDKESKIKVEVPQQEIEINELNLAISDIDTLNPLRTKNSHLADILKLIYEPLIGFDENNQIENMLAESWEKKDNLTWIIKLRKNIYWHDGEKMLTSSDVLYTINLLINNEINSVYTTNIKNIKSVDVVDDYNLVITLNEEDPYFISKLTFPIIPEHYFKGDGINDEKKANNPNGTGPYKYTLSDEQKITLSFNDMWWKSKAFKLKNIYLTKYSSYSEAIKGFKSSEVDMIITNMYKWKESFGFIGINSFGYESSEYETIIANANGAVLKEPSVRRAIRQAINMENIITSIYEGNGTIQDVPIISNSKYAGGSTEYDVEKAKQILINAGWVEKNNSWQKNGRTLSFNLLVPESDETKIMVAEQIKEDLNEISIKINIKKSSWESIKKAISANSFELVLATLDIKNEYMLQDIVTTGNSNNYSNYSNPEMDIVINNLKSSTGEEYDVNMEEFKRIYKNDVPYIGLYFKNNTILTNKSVKGEYKSNSFNPYRNIMNFSK